METQVVTTFFYWQLENFKKRFVKINGESVNSDPFSLNGGSAAKFQIQIIANYIYLGCTDFGQHEEIELNAKFWIKDGDEKLGEFVRLCAFKKAKNVVQSEDFIPEPGYDELKAQLSDGSATIVFQLQQNFPIDEVSVHDVNSHGNIGEAILSLHEDVALITIKAEEKEIKIFKHFLIHHSEVFEKMLTLPDSIEAQTGIITMENTKSKVIEDMRNWMYTINSDNFDEIAPSLFKIAHKYMIVKLKEVCVHSMCRGFTWENVPTRLIMAHKYSEDLLKERTLKFIRNDLGNLRHLMMSDEWIKLNRDDAELVKQIVNSI